MFCDRCGTQLQPGHNLCPKCGKVIGETLSFPAESRLGRHLHTLGILWIVVGAFWLIPSIVLMTLASVVHIAIPGTEAVARMVGPLVMFVLGATFLVVGAGGICVGWGLLQRQPWARTVAIVLGILALFHPPFGTALGIYTLWVLLAAESRGEYDHLARAA